MKNLKKANKWYVAEEKDFNGNSAYIAQKDLIIAYPRKFITCGAFSRDLRSVEQLVEALNRRKTTK